MRLIARDDSILTAALIASAAIIFRQPLHDVLEAIHDVEGRLHLDLLPALLLLIFAFSFHQYGKRAEARIRMRAAEAEATRARAQSQELQQLIGLSHGLTAALDRRALQDVLAARLPAVAPDRAFWVLMRAGERWEPLLHDEKTAPPLDDLLQLAKRVDAGDASAQAACVPLRAGDLLVGLLGIVGGQLPLGDTERGAVDTAAAVIAIAIRNMQLFLDLREVSLRDPLTGCFTRAHTLSVLDAELRRVTRTGGPLSVIMFDIDQFKEVNDRWGHLRGDAVLTAVGDRLSKSVRASDVRCRYGGDEFLVILPDTPSRGAQHVAEALRKEMASLSLREHAQVSVTISVGVATALPGETATASLLDRADRALYRAKQDGRNRVATAHNPTPFVVARSQPGAIVASAS